MNKKNKNLYLKMIFLALSKFNAFKKVFFGNNMNCMEKKVDFLYFINFLVYSEPKTNRTGHMFKNGFFRTGHMFKK